MINKIRNMIFKRKIKKTTANLGGRPSKIVDTKLVVELKKSGMSNRAIAKQLNVSASKIDTVIRTIIKN